MTGWTKVATVVAAAAILAMTTSGAGAANAPAGATGPKPAMSRNAVLLRHADLRTVAGAERYFRAIGVNPSGLVIQRAARNYAGPNCPGAGWACTSTTHPVIQLSRPGGKNTFLCVSRACVVVQTSGRPTRDVSRGLAATSPPQTNLAACIKTTGLTQSCSITQTGTTTNPNNQAIVVQGQVAGAKMSGLTQAASYSAQITQSASSGNNTACVLQQTNIDGSTNLSGKKGQAINVSLEAHQSIQVIQDSLTGADVVKAATASGGCDADGTSLTQTQTLTSDATGTGQITQNENASSNGPNVSLDIEQNRNGAYHQATGPTTANYSQTNTLSAVGSTPSTSPSNSQTQSSPKTPTSPGGGIDATVNQYSTGTKTISSTQTETQCERAGSLGPLPIPGSPADCQGRPQTNPPGWTETQNGPIRKGSGPSVQEGSSDASFVVTQNSSQTNDSGQAANQNNAVEADCSVPTNASCTVNQTANGTTNTQSGQTISAQINCTGSACIAFNGAPGTASPPATLGPSASPYTMTPFGADPQAVCPPTALTTTVADPAGTVTFDEALNHDRVGGCWATWSNGYTGDVYDTAQSTNKTQVTMTLPAGTNAFYFYAEPNVFNTFTIQATAQDGTTSGPIQVQGNSGAKYFGFYGTGGATISSITVATSDTTGFAVGEFGINPAAPPIP